MFLYQQFTCTPYLFSKAFTQQLVLNWASVDLLFQCNFQSWVWSKPLSLSKDTLLPPQPTYHREGQIQMRAVICENSISLTVSIQFMHTIDVVGKLGMATKTIASIPVPPGVGQTQPSVLIKSQKNSLILSLFLKAGGRWGRWYPT